MSESEKMKLEYDSLGRTFITVNGMLHVVRQIQPDELCIELTGRLRDSQDVTDHKCFVVGWTPAEIRSNLIAVSSLYTSTLTIHIYLKAGKSHLFDLIYTADAVHFIERKEIAEFLDSEILRSYASLNKPA